MELWSGRHFLDNLVSLNQLNTPMFQVGPEVAAAIGPHLTPHLKPRRYRPLPIALSVQRLTSRWEVISLIVRNRS